MVAVLDPYFICIQAVEKIFPSDESATRLVKYEY